jgi:predicted transcriptional regulator
MTSTQSIRNLEKMADLYQQFMELEPHERKWLKEMLHGGRKLTVEILEVISEESLTYEEIADRVGCSPTTVTQKLNALARGGFPVNLSATTAILETGRPRKLARKSEESILDEIKKLVVKQ